jgi:hypothetical protein
MPRTKPAADGPRPVPGGGGAGDRVRRGDERIGAVIDVEEDALRALEQDAIAVEPRLVQRRPRPGAANCSTKSAISPRSRSSRARSTGGSPKPARSAS